MFGLERIARLFRRTELDCTDVRKMSSEYMEGNLSPSLMERFRAHISKCGPCQTFVDSLMSMVGMLTKMPKMSSPPTLNESIMNRIAEERNKGKQ